MPRQRQILVTVTYNDIGCIIDTKAEPYKEPNLQPTCNQLATDMISRQRVSDLFDAWEAAELDHHIPKILRDRLKVIPPAQSDIIRCNACKHWTQTTGNMPGFGLGDCDYLNAKLVSCNGFCYWAERRTDG